MNLCSNYRLFRCVLLVVAFTYPCVAAHASEIHDRLCGPRCVKYIFGYYEVETDLVALIREIQWPNIDGGSSMAALASSLRKHDLYCCAVAAPQSHHLRYQYPVIVPLQRDGILHFVVWLPSSSATEVQYWDGLDGIRSTSADVFHGNRSEEVLLTATQSVVHPEEAFAAPNVNFTESKLLTAILLALVAVSLSRWPSRVGGRFCSKEKKNEKFAV